jgi:hypothetical protein
VVRLGNLRHGVGQAVKKDWLMQHGRVGDLLMDALDSVAIGVSGDEDDGYLAYLSKPSSRLDPFATSFETNVHQDDIGWIAHGTRKSISCIWNQIANVEAQSVHLCFQAYGDPELIFDD